MPPTDDIDELRRKLAHADAVIAELRGVVADLRKQVESQEAHIQVVAYWRCTAGKAIHSRIDHT